MPAGLTEADSMFSVRERPWHGLGVVLDRPPSSIGEALHLAGLDWEVRQAEVFYDLPRDIPMSPRMRPRMRTLGRAKLALIPDSEKREVGREVEADPNPGLRNVRVNMRSDTGEPLGVVSTSYEVVNNRDAFAFLSNVIGSEMHFETAGSLWGGRRVWVLVRTPDWIEVGGDAVQTFLCVDTRHDGKGAVRGVVTPVRVVCQNTLHVAITNAVRQFAVKHFGNPSRALADARTALGITVDYARQFKAVGDRLASERVTVDQTQRVLRQLYPTDEVMPERTQRNRIASRETITAILEAGGPTTGNAPGSRWALYNAICEYVDWYGGRSERTLDTTEQRERAFARAIDDPKDMKAHAFELVAN